MTTEIIKRGRIDAIEKYSYPVAAGIEVNMIETYSTLASQGWDVTIHTSRDTLTEKNVLSDFELHRGIKVKRYRYTLLGYFPDIDWEHADLVCLHNFNVLPHFYIMVRVLILKLLGQKRFSLILTPHGGFNPEWSIFPKWIALMKQVYHYTVGTWLINHAVDGMRAVSEWERKEAVGKGVTSELVRTISNGIEDDAYRNIDDEASNEVRKQAEGYGRYIIQVGRVYSIKNYETTLRALALVSQKDLNYVIVGPLADYGYKKYLDELIVELHLEGRVFFAGVVRGVDKFYLIKHAQMMVHMALWESFCNVVHEGMSQGLVCIVADNTALPLLIKNDINGYCLPTKDHDKLAETIERVLQKQDDPAILRMKENNLFFGRQHTWSMVAQHMERFYLESLAAIRKND
jgi:glycosyltransferase involved in cell wall biosynthesis